MCENLSIKRHLNTNTCFCCFFKLMNRLIVRVYRFILTLYVGRSVNLTTSKWEGIWNFFKCGAEFNRICRELSKFMLKNLPVATLKQECSIVALEIWEFWSICVNIWFSGCFPMNSEETTPDQLMYLWVNSSEITSTCDFAEKYLRFDI